MRKNKIELRRALGEEVQERYEEMEYRLGNITIFWLSEYWNIREMIGEERMLQTKQIEQFYCITR